MTNADKRRATITYLKTLEHLPSLDPRKKQSLREVAKATGASHATVKNIRSELEMAVKILQFNEGARVQVICSDNYQDKTYFRTGTLGTNGLSDTHLKSLIKAAKRVLSKRHHPEYGKQ